MNRYRVMLPILVDGEHGQGDEFEKELSEEEEATNLASGLLEIVPKRYRVVGTSRVHETDPGEEFEAALLLGQERMLIEGGHIEVAADKPKRTKKEGVK